MYRRITACFLAICLLIAAAPMHAGAAAGQNITASTVSVTAGNTVSVTIRAENLEAVATLETSVYYDSSVLTLSSTYTGSMLSGSSNSINTNEAGKVKLVTMNVNGISGSGTLMTLYFQTSGTAEPGTYPITVAVGNAWNTDLSAVTIGSQSGSVTITEYVETEKFTIYAYPSQRTLQNGDILSYRVASASSSRPFVSGDFLITYDHELFAFDSVQLESPLLGADAIYSVNSSALGQVRITYAKATPVQTFYLLTVKLKVIADTDTTTTVTAQASNMYRENLTAYLPGSTSTTLTLQKLPEVVDDPDAFLQTERLVVGSQSKSTFYLEEGANVAAADFCLTYDSDVLRCVSVAASSAVADNGGMVIINDNYTGGEIRFSYINMEGYDDTDLPIVEITWEPLASPDAHYQVSVSATDVVDPQQGQLQLEYVTDTGCIYSVSVAAPGCTEKGYTEYRCNACDDFWRDTYVDSLGHNYAAVITAPTCTEDGYTTNTCATCGDTYVADQVAALGHAYKAVVTPPTCTKEGYTTYTCATCGDTCVDDQVAALGHDYKAVVTAPTCTEDGYTTYTCTCGANYVSDQVTALGHDYKAVVTPPTCTKEGYTTYTCATCGDRYEADQVAAPGHDYKAVVTAPTCTEDGYTTYTCTCGANYVSDRVTALGHAYKAVVTAPTCTEAGYTTYTCTCGANYVSDRVTALGHAYKAVVTAPTCTKEGYTTNTCTCGHSYVDGHVEALGHTGGEATCVSGKICTNCGTPYGDTDPDAHDYDNDGDSQCNLCGESRTLTGLLGDLNLDGLVNSDDLTLLARHVGGIELITGEALANGDVTGDGAINSDDLTLHARYVGGIISDWGQE